MKKQLTTLIEQLSVNIRLRAGLWLILGIIGLYGMLVLKEAVASKEMAYAALNKKITRAQTLAGQADWPERLEAVRALQIDLESQLWREETIGLAQASFQDWLNQLAQQTNLNRPLVAVAGQDLTGNENPAPNEKILPADHLWKVSAKLSFDFQPQSFYTLMSRLANHDKKIVVESLTIRTGAIPRAETVLIAYFQKTEKTDSQ